LGEVVRIVGLPPAVAEQRLERQPRVGAILLVDEDVAPVEVGLEDQGGNGVRHPAKVLLRFSALIRPRQHRVPIPGSQNQNDKQSQGGDHHGQPLGEILWPEGEPGRDEKVVGRRHPENKRDQAPWDPRSQGRDQDGWEYKREGRDARGLKIQKLPQGGRAGCANQPHQSGPQE
jgi:hypothetical protein